IENTLVTYSWRKTLKFQDTAPGSDLGKGLLNRPSRVGLHRAFVTLCGAIFRGGSMNYTVRKTMVISSALLLAYAGALIGARAQNPPQRAPQGGPKTAAQQFKNIQILKDIPADQLIPSMQFITASLGVDCEFCHVERAFDKDDKKPKQFARHMMEMMFNINK